MTEDLYETLGVPRDASPEAIKAAHRAYAKRFHPDAGGNREAFQRSITGVVASHINPAVLILPLPTEKPE